MTRMRTSSRFKLGIALAMSLSYLPAQALTLPPAPTENPTTPQKAVLGKMLFFEEQLSSNGRMACARCHLPRHGGGDARRTRHPGPDGVLLTSDDTYGSPGVRRRAPNGTFVEDPLFGLAEQVTPRAAPSTHMAGYFDELFWDGRAEGPFVDPETGATVIATGGALEALTLHPLLDATEMSREQRGWNELKQRLAIVTPLALATDLTPDIEQALLTAPDYPQLFAAAFGDSNISAARMAMAMAAYIRTLAPDQTPWDLHMQGVPNVMTASQLAGWQLFQNQARCALCHTPGLFTDRQFRGDGLTPATDDPGRGGITNAPSDMGKFKVPSLRNVGLKGTLMHNGRFTSITQVANFYRLGAGFAGPRDPLLQALPITQLQVVQLVDFLENGLVDPRARHALPPFDRPTLRSESQPIGSNEFGTATAILGYTPQLTAHIPTYLGNSEWAIGVQQAPPQAASLFLLALLPATPGATLAGVTLNVDAPGALVLPTATDSDGKATIPVAVPMVPALAGITLYGQFLVNSGIVPHAWCGTTGVSLPLF